MSQQTLLMSFAGFQRGIMIEWLEGLDCGAESCQKGMSCWAWPSDDWKTLSVNPAGNGYLFRTREG